MVHKQHGKPQAHTVGASTDLNTKLETRKMHRPATASYLPS